MSQTKRSMRKMNGAQKLVIASSIFKFIHSIVMAGIRDAQDPRATRQEIKKELSRRMSL